MTLKHAEEYDLIVVDSSDPESIVLLGISSSNSSKMKIL